MHNTILYLFHENIFKKIKILVYIILFIYKTYDKYYIVYLYN